MMRVQAAILAILLPMVATAAPPKPAAEKVTVAVGELTRVEVVADAAGAVGWASGAADADLFVDELAPRAGKTRLLIQAKKAGTYRLVLWSKGETDSTFVEVVAGGGSPAPVDPVKPDPKPDVVKASKVSIVVVEESAQRTVKQGETMAALRKWADMGGHVMFVVDKDDPTASKNGYAPLTSVGMPTVLVFDQAGKAGDKPLSAFKMPDGADAINKVKEVLK